jgi:2-oxoglutarate dehydrogenase E2 component (dihydrolipoamide succinyltransferase)
MLSRRVLVASRFLRSARAPHLRYPSPVVQQFRLYADRVVKVPEMAESISEGTLKQWSKQIGDFVEQDEEIATIETDKVCYAVVNFPVQTDTSSFLDRCCCQCA